MYKVLTCLQNEVSWFLAKLKMDSFSSYSFSVGLLNRPLNRKICSHQIDIIRPPDYKFAVNFFIILTNSKL